MIEQDRLQPVAGLGETRVGTLGRLEFIPGGAEGLSLIRGQQAEQDIGRRLLAFGLAMVGQRQMQRGVAGLDLHQIVQDQHLHHAPDIDRLHRVVLKHHGKEGEMPGMFGGILTPGSVRDVIEPDHALQPVGFQKEAELIGKAASDLIKPGG